MRQGRTQNMEEILALYLKRMNLSQQFKEWQVRQVWGEVVGEMIANRTKALRVSEGKLWVSFTSSVVRNEILLVKEGLLKKLNQRVGEEVIKDIIAY